MKLQFTFKTIVCFFFFFTKKTYHKLVSFLCIKLCTMQCAILNETPNINDNMILLYTHLWFLNIKYRVIHGKVSTNIVQALNHCLSKYQVEVDQNAIALGTC